MKIANQNNVTSQIGSSYSSLFLQNKKVDVNWITRFNRYFDAAVQLVCLKYNINQVNTLSKLNLSSF